MYDTLYQYLILHKHLSLPGVGTIHLQRTPAQRDFINKAFTAPGYSFSIDSSSDKPSKKLFDWLSVALGISEWDAIRMVNDFAFELKKNISSAGKVSWVNVGVLHRSETGSIVLEPAETVSEQPVIAEKILREKAEYTVRVGEMEKSFAEFEELPTEKPVEWDYGWVIAIVLTIASLMFAGWYFSEKGLNPASAGNQMKVGK